MCETLEWLVDGHVHFHACFERDGFLDHAAANFDAARGGGAAQATPGLLLLTECAGVDFFGEARRRAAGGDGAGRWRFEATAEAESVWARAPQGPGVLLVAGRQVVTAEALEVLALGTTAVFPDGRPAAETIDAVRRAGALPVLPWGFGKWWFARGALVESLVRSRPPDEFFLGDNGGRPRLAGRPRLLAAGERRGIRVLPGSDPLPFPRHVSRAGSFGCRLVGEIDPERPAEGLKRALREPSLRPRPYGAAQRLLPFVRNQLAMQLRKREAGAS